MAEDLRRRVERLEKTTGGSGGLSHRLYLQPSDCPDLAAWERDCEAEAARDQVHPIIVKFVKPGDIAPAGRLH